MCNFNRKRAQLTPENLVPHLCRESLSFSKSHYTLPSSVTPDSTLFGTKRTATAIKIEFFTGRASSGMILASGARGRGFNSRLAHSVFLPNSGRACGILDARAKSKRVQRDARAKILIRNPGLASDAAVDYCAK